MRVSDSFRAFVLEQLADVTSVRARAMFGGVGLYSGDVFFGLIAADVLYLKVGERNRVRYESAGMTAFAPYPDKPMTMPYYQVPVHVLEDRRELAVWAHASIDVAVESKPRRPRR